MLRPEVILEYAILHCCAEISAEARAIRSCEEQGDKAGMMMYTQNKRKLEDNLTDLRQLYKLTVGKTYGDSLSE